MYTIKVVCAYCNKDLGAKPCSKEMDGATSHGLCLKCAKKENEEIDRMIAEVKALKRKI